MYGLRHVFREIEGGTGLGEEGVQMALLSSRNTLVKHKLCGLERADRRRRVDIQESCFRLGLWWAGDG